MPLDHWTLRLCIFSKRQEPITQWPGIISQKMVFSTTPPWKPEDCHSGSCFSVTNSIILIFFLSVKHKTTMKRQEKCPFFVTILRCIKSKLCWTCSSGGASWTMYHAVSACKTVWALHMFQEFCYVCHYWIC